MARHKDFNWHLPEGTPDGKGKNTHEWPSIHAALLMDIRDELQRLNATLACQNFQNIPRELRGIRRDLKKTREGAK